MPPSRQSRPPINPWFAACAILGVIVVCYWPSMHGGILWDDAAHIPRPELRSWEGLLRMWTDLRATQQFYPVLFSSFWVQHRIWGDTTFYYHVVNCLEHAASCILFALILQRLWAPRSALDPRTVPPGTEWLAALIFAVHPVCVESVAWITEQKNTLSLLFYLSAAYLYLHFDRSRSWRTYAWATVCFLLALGSKSVTATLPPALLVVLWWRDGRLEWRRHVAPILPWFTLAVAAGIFTAWVEHSIIGAGAGNVYTLDAMQRVLLAGRAVWFYLGKLVWPVDLMFFYPRWPDPTLAWAGWLIAALFTTYLLWSWRGRTRGPLAAWLLFIGALVPILGLFDVYFFLFSYVNDHFQYQAMLPVIALAAAGLGQGIAGATGWRQRCGQAGTCVAMFAFAWLAREQTHRYTDMETHYRAILATNPASWMAHNNLGTVLRQQPGREAETTAHFVEAIRLNPNYAEARNNLAIRLAHMPGREAEALWHYLQALRIFPGYPIARNNLALLVARLPAGSLASMLPPPGPGLPPEMLAEMHHNLADCLRTLPGREAEAQVHDEVARGLLRR